MIARSLFLVKGTEARLFRAYTVKTAYYSAPGALSEGARVFYNGLVERSKHPGLTGRPLPGTPRKDWEG